MKCYECHVNELPPPYKGFPAVRCAECAVKWAARKWGLVPAQNCLPDMADVR